METSTTTTKAIQTEKKPTEKPTADQIAANWLLWDSVQNTVNNYVWNRWGYNSAASEDILSGGRVNFVTYNTWPVAKKGYAIDCCRDSARKQKYLDPKKTKKEMEKVPELTAFVGNPQVIGGDETDRIVCHRKSVEEAMIEAQELGIVMGLLDLVNPRLKQVFGLIQGGVKQGAAARQCGMSDSQLSKHISKLRAKVAEAAELSQFA